MVALVGYLAVGTAMGEVASSRPKSGVVVVLVVVVVIGVGVVVVLAVVVVVVVG